MVRPERILIALLLGLRPLKRCDGARPFCTQCVRGNRAEDCEYTDTQGRTRTQILEENVALLQARIDELESPGRNLHSIVLHDPYQRYQSAGATSQLTLEQQAVVPPPLQPGSVPAVQSWWEVEEPPSHVRDTLYAPSSFKHLGTDSSRMQG